MIKGSVLEPLIRECVKIIFEEYMQLNANYSNTNQRSSCIQSRHPRLIAIKEWEKIHRAPTESGLRHLIFNSRRNGFESCIRRIGRRVFIREDAFFDWVEKNGTGSINL